MNKKDLIRKIAITTKMTYKEIDLILTSTLENIILAVSKGERVRLVGFGSFYKSQKVKKNLPNCENKTFVSTQNVSVRAKFSVGKFFKEKVNDSLKNVSR
jgi:DNA-binding protein HU-beta